jgi:Anti-sigma-K factor rskA
VNQAATCDDIIELAAAVAVDALDEDEARQVEAHAAACARCAVALQEFREAACVLGAAVGQVEPPPALRTRILHAARQEQPATVPRPPRLARLRRVSPAWIGVAAAVVLSAFSLFRVVMLQNQVANLESALTAQSGRYDRVASVLASEQLAVRSLQPVAQTVNSRGMVYLDSSSGTGMLMCRNLPPIAPGHAYQIWFVRGNERVSGGMLWPDGFGNGYTLIDVPSDLQSFDSIGLTDEPGNGGRGSEWPTTPRVIGTALKEHTN